MSSKISRITRTAAAVAAAVAFGAPAAADAQSFVLCNSSNQVCSGVVLTLIGSTAGAQQLQVDFRNFGTTPAVSSFVTGFGLFALPAGVSASALQSATFTGTGSGENVNLLTSGFASFGAQSDLQQGAGTQPLAFGVDFGNSGFATCGNQQISGGFSRFETCANEFGRFVFNLSGSTALTSAQLANLGFAFRTQGIGGTGSDKCFSAGDVAGNGNAGCTLTAAPAGAVIGGTLAVVPEPSTYLLLGSGLLGVMGIAARRRRQA